MSNNKLVIAAAGSGKTKLIVDEVKDNTTGRVLITTFTIANEQSIRERLISANNGCMPPNVTVQTWFSFLIEHGVRPYRFWDESVAGRVEGMLFVSEPSGFRCMNNYTDPPTPMYWGEDTDYDFRRCYFDGNMRVYSDKLARLVCRCNKESGKRVVARLEKIFSHIYIDEVQDMAGYDLDIILLLLRSKLDLTMVGDPRQTVYQTHNPKRKNKDYLDGKIDAFVKAKCNTRTKCLVDDTSLKNSYRNSAEICALSSRLFPEYPICESRLCERETHMGLFFIKKSDAQLYISTFEPMQLRWGIKKSEREAVIDASTMTFGVSKGLQFCHTLIYPTKKMRDWLVSRSVEFSTTTRAKFYVAITRAFFSVGFVVPNDFSETVDDIVLWEPPTQ